MGRDLWVTAFAVWIFLLVILIANLVHYGRAVIG